jgi:hypothetical protein
MKSLIYLLSVSLISFGNVVFAQDKPPVVTAKVVERPTYYPGDWWDITTGGTTVRQEVKTVDGGRITIQVAGRTMVPYDTIYTEEMNLVNGYGGRTGGAVAYAPHNRSLAFPLQVGKKWDGEVTWTSPPSYTGNYHMDAEAVGWEKITVGKAEYDALRIEYKGSSGRGPSTCRYVVEAKRMVRCDGSVTFKLDNFSVH